MYAWATRRPRASRRLISALLNAAWLCHFGSLAGHLGFPYYSQSQELVPALCQNVPFALSILSQLSAVLLQSRAEKRVIEADVPKPPQLLPFVLRACADWRELRRAGAALHARGGDGARCKVSDAESNGAASARARGGGGALAKPPALRGFVRGKWREWCLINAEHRAQYSKRVQYALTGIETHKAPLSESDAVRKIAAAERGRRAREEVRGDRKTKEQAATVLAAVVRGRASRRQHEADWRGHADRGAAAPPQRAPLTQAQAATKIAAVHRGNTVRRRLRQCA